jgi:hypothetical protein
MNTVLIPTPIFRRVSRVALVLVNVCLSNVSEHSACVNFLWCKESIDGIDHNVESISLAREYWTYAAITSPQPSLLEQLLPRSSQSIMYPLIFYYVMIETFGLVLYFGSHINPCSYESFAYMRFILFVVVASSSASHRTYTTSMQAHDAAIHTSTSDTDAYRSHPEIVPLFGGGGR